MESVEALLDGWLLDGGSEVTASALSLELQLPLDLARKLLYVHLSKRLSAGECFRVFFAQATHDGVRMQSAVVSSPLLPPLECLYGAKKTAPDSSNEAESGDDAQLQWRSEIRALEAAFSSCCALDAAAEESSQMEGGTLYVPPFASLRLPRLMARKTTLTLEVLPSEKAKCPRQDTPISSSRQGGLSTPSSAPAWLPHSKSTSSATGPCAGKLSKVVAPLKTQQRLQQAFAAPRRAESTSAQRTEDASIRKIESKAASEETPEKRRLETGETKAKSQTLKPRNLPHTPASIDKLRVVSERRGGVSGESPELRRKKAKMQRPLEEADTEAPERNIFAEDFDAEEEEEHAPDSLQDSTLREENSQRMLNAQAPGHTHHSEASQNENKDTHVGANVVTIKEKVTGSRCFKEGNYFVFEDFQEVQQKTVPVASPSPVAAAKPHLRQSTPSRPSSRAKDQRQKSITAFFSKK